MTATRVGAPATSASKLLWGAHAQAQTQLTGNSADSDEGRMICVGNVPASAEWQELKDHMKQVGTVEFVQVMQRGTGFVRYATADEANAAIAELNGSVMPGMAPGKFLLVDFWTGEKPKTNKGKSKGPDAGAGCGGGCGKGGFGGGFGGGGAAYGSPAAFGGGKGKGGGVWLSWEDYQQMSQMMMSMKGMANKGAAKSPAAFASPGFGSRDPTFKVRVDGLADGCKWQELKDHMKQVGTVEFTNVKDGQGEVRFSCAEEAQNAIDTLDGSELMGTLIVVSAWEG